MDPCTGAQATVAEPERLDRLKSESIRCTQMVGRSNTDRFITLEMKCLVSTDDRSQNRVLTKLSVCTICG